jgi:hypothetical protein
MKHGQIHVYGGQADPYIINKDDYKVEVTKTWVPSTLQWHIKFTSTTEHEHHFELFLNSKELEHLRRIL